MNFTVYSEIVNTEMGNHGNDTQPIILFAFQSATHKTF